MAEVSWFHVADGLFFGRRPDGSVEVVKTSDGLFPDAWRDPDAPSAIAFRQVVDGDGWCSVIASVSARGEDGTTYSLAREFHEPGTPGGTS